MEEEVRDCDGAGNDAITLYERNGAKSLVPVIPRDSNVLIKMVYKNSILGIRALAANDQKFRQIDIKELQYTIVGCGDKVTNLEIGDKVFVSLQPKIIVDVPTNDRSLKRLGETIKAFTKEENDKALFTSKWEVIEYGVFDSFDISAFLVSDNG